MIATHRAAHDRQTARIAELLGKPYLEAAEPLAEALAEWNRAGKRNLFQEFSVAYDACARKIASCQARACVARTGLRLKAYRAEHGNYPATLAVLDLADIPVGKRIDPFTGRSLVYRTEGKGFVLYSLGPDAVDNGGREWQTGDKDGFDIVWRAKR